MTKIKAIVKIKVKEFAGNCGAACGVARLADTYDMRFTRENAAANAYKAHQKQRENIAAKKLRMAALEHAVLNPAPAAPPVNQSEVDGRLVTLRRQMAKLNAMFDRERNAVKLDRLAAAIQKLSAEERILLRIPTPGTERPNGKRPRQLLNVAPIRPHSA